MASALEHWNYMLALHLDMPFHDYQQIYPMLVNENICLHLDTLEDMSWENIAGVDSWTEVMDFHPQRS